MRKHRIVFLISLVVLLVLVGVYVVLYSINDEKIDAFQDLPDWVKGTLCIKTEGFLMSDEMRKTMLSDTDRRWRDDYLTRQTYALFCDFSNKEISSQRIPTDAVLVEMHGTKPGAELIFRVETGTRGEECEYLGIPSAFAVAEYSVTDERFDGKSISEVEPVEAPIKILDFQEDENRIYYLKYAVSEVGELEIQLVCTQDGVEFVYEHYPLISHTSFGMEPVGFSKWRYAISPNGKICWTDPYSWNLKTYFGESPVVVPGSFMVGSVCWTDDNSMFYFKRGEKRQLHMYNAETGQSELFVTPNGKTIELVSGEDVAMAINKEHNVLAVYSITGWFEPGYDQLHFFSLNTGEQFDIVIDDGITDQQMENSLWRILPDDLGLDGYIYCENSYYSQSTDTKFDAQLCWLN